MIILKKILRLVKNQKHLSSKIEKLQNKHCQELDAKDQQIITIQKTDL
jgi:hypothetical protein